MKRTYLTFLSMVRLGSFLLLLASVALIALGQFLWGGGGAGGGFGPVHGALPLPGLPPTAG